MIFNCLIEKNNNGLRSTLIIIFIAVLFVVPTANAVNIQQKSIFRLDQIQSNDEYIGWSPKGDALFVNNNHDLFVINASNGCIILTINAGSERIRDMDWSPDGTQLASISSNGVSFWRRDDGAYQGSLSGKDSAGNNLAWSPDGDKIATAADERYLKIWNPSDKSLIKCITDYHYLNRINSMSWNTDGSILAIADINRIILIDLLSDSNPIIIIGEESGIMDFDWSPDGRQIVTAIYDGAIRIYDSKNGERINPCIGNSTHPTWMSSVAWSPDGKVIASGSADGKIRIWAGNNGTLLQVLDGSDEDIHDLVWSPNGRYLGSVSGHTVKIWDNSEVDSTRLININSLLIQDKKTTSKDDILRSPNICFISIGAIGLSTSFLVFSIMMIHKKLFRVREGMLK